MSDRFDVEQGILHCWEITSDIDLFIDMYDNLTEDQKLNCLIGIKEIYQLKFEKLWEYFENCVRQMYV